MTVKFIKYQKAVIIDYTNWRGERSTRRVVPEKWLFGCTEWHKENQWLLIAYDLDKDTSRTFAMSDIHSWKNNPL